MTNAELRKRLTKMKAFCLTASFFQERFQFVCHFDSAVTPYVEGLPLPDWDEALENALTCAEKVRKAVL